MSENRENRQRHGAVVIAENLTRFSLWAPDAQDVSVEIVNGESLPLNAQDDGWFVLETRCAAGTHYSYKIDGNLAVPDPASRAQYQDVAGPSVVVDHQAHQWKNTWHGRPWHEAVIYELHVGALGGFTGVEKRLQHLVETGVTAIELMPIAQFSGHRNWGYDGVLPYAPQSSYGTPEELKHLIDTAHGLGLMVILDVVYNHFGPDGNYLGSYAKDFFRSDIKTPWGNAIDFRRREVRDFFIDNSLMWLFDYRFDGLRFDAIHAIKDPTFLQELAQRVRQQTPVPRQVWLILENEFNEASRMAQGFDAQWNDDGHNTLHVLLTAETDAYYTDFAAQPTQKLARLLSEGFVYQGEATRHGNVRGEASSHLSPTAFVLFLQNHDQIGNRALGERLVRLCPEPALRAATALLLLSPMIPLMFMGDEWGANEPFLFFTDFHDELADAVREGRRGEFAEFAAFADPQKREYIPDPNAEKTFESSRPQFDVLNSQADKGQNHHRWLGLYRELLQIRQREIFPRLQGAQALGASVLADKAITARWQMGDGSVLRIDLNLSEHGVKTEEYTVKVVLYQSSSGSIDRLSRGELDSYTIVISLE
jgi:maltooligosyltrehalose trehalohydrolase